MAHRDPDSQRFQAEVDEVVRRWAGEDPKEYWRRWKQLGSWSISRTQGDVIRKAALKKRLMAETEGRCTRSACGPAAAPGATAGS